MTHYEVKPADHDQLVTNIAAEMGGIVLDKSPASIGRLIRLFARAVLTVCGPEVVLTKYHEERFPHYGLIVYTGMLRRNHHFGIGFEGSTMVVQARMGQSVLRGRWKFLIGPADMGLMATRNNYPYDDPYTGLDIMVHVLEAVLGLDTN